jgi:hypothetical protein
MPRYGFTALLLITLLTLPAIAAAQAQPAGDLLPLKATEKTL